MRCRNRDTKAAGDLDGHRGSGLCRELAALKRMFALAVQAGTLSAKPYIPRLEENNARQGFLDHASERAPISRLGQIGKPEVRFHQSNADYGSDCTRSC